MSDTYGPLPASTRNGAAREEVLETRRRAPAGEGQVSYRSRGRLLLIGPDAAVASALARVTDALEARVLLTEDAGASPSHPDFHQLGARARRARPLALHGHLGSFRVTVSSGDDERDLAEEFELDPGTHFDLVVDLGATPLLSRALDPPGYFRPRDDEALAAALEEAAELIGEFEKPRYFEYDPDICVHGNRGQRGCTRCLDACATEAIRSVGDRIEVDPYLCQGCGSCATSCPTGAIAYAWPRPQRLLEQVRQLLQGYREAGGEDPVVLFHDGEAGGAAVAEWAQDLPDSALPVEIEDAGSIGLDTWLATLAWGAGRVITVLPPGMPAVERDTTIEQIRIGSEILRGLDLPGDRIDWVEPGARLEVLAEAPSPLLPEPARFAALGNKREVIHAALRHLHQETGSPGEAVPLPEGAPWGDVIVDGDACTLCVACVSVCPTQALIGGGEQPTLSFREDRCVQCGLCESTCPENAITRESRLDFSAITEPRERRLHEEAPHFCPECGKPFSTRKLIDRMQQRLSTHWMFSDPDARRRLELCEDCRIEAVMRDEGSIDPYRGA